MSGTRIDKLAVALAPLMARLELEGDALACVAGIVAAGEAVDRLAASSHLTEAVRLVAHALPKREAVWWLCICARAIPDPSLATEDLATLDAAEAWVRRPDEEARRRAMECAERTAFRSPEAWAGMAAAWSGGSMAPAGQPAVPPADHMTGLAVAGGVILASVRLHELRAPDRILRFLASAREIAAGGAGRMEPEAG